MAFELLLCCLLAIATANPVRLDNGTTPYQNHGVQDIVNGQNSVYGYVNSMLSLKEKGAHKCGAVLISATRALTAAHCLKEGVSYTVQAGELNFDHTSGHEVNKTVTEFIKHPEYGGSLWGNNIAVLKFDAIPLGTYRKPLRLAKPSDEPLKHWQCWIAGYGKVSGEASAIPRILQTTDVNVMDNSVCSQTLPCITDNNVCLQKSRKGGISTCQGDAGGPLKCSTFSGMVLGGIASWPDGLCSTEIPSVFTKVSKYREWINQNM